MHSCVGLGHAEHTFDVTHSDGDATNYGGLAADVGIELGHLVSINLVHAGMAVALCIDYVLFEKLLLERLDILLLAVQNDIFKHILVQLSLDLNIALILFLFHFV